MFPQISPVFSAEVVSSKMAVAVSWNINESKIERINGCEYGLLPLPNGQMAYCLLSIEGHDLDTPPPLPYQSTEYPLVISVEEMKRLKKQLDED